MDMVDGDMMGEEWLRQLRPRPLNYLSKEVWMRNFRVTKF